MSARNVLLTHREGGWQIRKVDTYECFNTKLMRRMDEVQEMCDRVPTMYIMEAIGGGELNSLPGGYFGTYHRCTPMRLYRNLYIADLYWLHEIKHLDTWCVGGTHTPPMLQKPGMRVRREPWVDWAKRAIDSELVAALWSECFPHILVPGLRARTFEHPIWVDRFLKNKKLIHAVRSGAMPFDALYELVSTERRRVLQHGAAFDDVVEDQVMGYYRTNRDWVRRYAQETIMFGPYKDIPAFRCVENHLPDVENVDKHMRWLSDVTPTRQDLVNLGLTSNYQLPLGYQAYTFGKVFTEYLRENSNDVFFK